MNELLESNSDSSNDGIVQMSMLGLATLAGLIAGGIGLFNAWRGMTGTGLEWLFLGILGLGACVVYFTLSAPLVLLHTKFRVARGRRYIQEHFGNLDVRINKRQVYLREHLRGQIVFDRLDGPSFPIKLTLVAKRFTYLGYGVGGQIPRWNREVVWDSTTTVQSSDAVGKKVPFSILVNVRAGQMRGDSLNGKISLTRLHPFELLIEIPNLPTIPLYPDISTNERSRS
jgi:MFS family permease